MARKISDTAREKVMNEYNDYVRRINENMDQIEKDQPDSIALERYRGYFREIKDKNLDYRTMQRMRKQAREVYESGQTSLDAVERSKELALKTLHEEGYDYINRKNFNSFMRFLDDARAKGLGSLYSSTQLIEKIREAKEKGLTKAEIKANIERWSKQIPRDDDGKEIEQIRPKKLTLRRYRK